MHPIPEKPSSQRGSTGFVVGVVDDDPAVRSRPASEGQHNLGGTPGTGFFVIGTAGKMWAALAGVKADRRILFTHGSDALARQHQQPDFATAIGLFANRHFPDFMGRFLVKMAERANLDLIQ